MAKLYTHYSEANSFSPTKQKVRDYLYNTVINHCGKENLNIVTLPNVNFDLERRLIEEGGMGTFYESVPSIFPKVKAALEKSMPNNRTFLIKGDILDHNPLGNENFMWLDLCGPLTDKEIDLFTLLMVRINYKRQYCKTYRKIPLVLALTCMKGDRPKNLRPRYEKEYGDYKNKGICSHVRRFMRGTIEAECIEYQRGKHHPMKMFIFKIN